MNLFVQPSARADILRQYAYYLERGVPSVAECFILAVNEAIDAAAALPQAGAPRRLGNPPLAGLRTWPVKGFEAVHVYYLVQADLLQILRILHGRRDIGLKGRS